MESGTVAGHACLKRYDRRQRIDALNLTSETRPSGSLRNAVLDRYVASLPADEQAPVMPTEDLLAFFATWRNYSTDPVEELTAEPGRPRPTPEYLALIRWVYDSHTHWETHYPLEEPLRSDLRALLPVAAGLSAVEGDYLVPGRHGFHRLMDALHAVSIGWHADLGRAGEPLRQQVQETVQRARQWLQDHSVDFERLADTVEKQAEEDEQRGQRMINRAIDAERGRLRAASARNRAAQMINALLEKYRTPRAIANFLKGPWYDSAQLVLLKHGPESDEWRSMRKTTEVLLDSLMEAPDPEDRHALQLIETLPSEVGGWLVSLQHDTEAQRNATQLIEYAHLRNLRGHPLELVENEPIVDADASGGETDQEAIAAVEALEEGLWFRIQRPGQNPRRARLILKLQDEQQLLFTNIIGIKEMQSSYADFGAMLLRGEAQRLEQGRSYSTALSDVALGTTEPHPGAAPETPGNASPTETAGDEKPNEAARAEQEERGSTSRVSYLKLVDTETGAGPPEEPDTPESLADSQELVPGRAEGTEGEELLDPDDEPDLNLNLDPEDEDYALHSMTLDTPDTPADTVDLWRRAADETLPREPGTHPAGHPDSTDPERFDTPTAGASPDATEDEVELRLPMGAWLGFHDLETPLMAKLAVHDREQDSYIFVDRNGIKLRDITRRNLIELIERGYVDILQAQSNFQEFLRKVRKESES